MAQIKINATYGLTGTLPAVSGANLTTLNASNVSSGTLNAARYVDTAGVTEFDMWRQNANHTADGGQITSNWERVDDTGQTDFEHIGTGMTESSGDFIFPSQGKWLIRFFATGMSTSEVDAMGVSIYTTEDSGNNWTIAAQAYSAIADATPTMYANCVCEYLFDVNDGGTGDASDNDKVRFNTYGDTIWGDTNSNTTYVSFTKLGGT